MVLSVSSATTSSVESPVLGRDVGGIVGFIGCGVVCAMLSFEVPSSIWSDLTGPDVLLWNLFGDVRKKKSRLFYNLQGLQDLSKNLTFNFCIKKPPL